MTANDPGNANNAGAPCTRLSMLFVVVLVLAAANLFWTAHEVNANNAARARQGAIIEARLCHDIGTMAALQPPPGPADVNPSRAYEQAEHRAWLAEFTDIGCKGTP